MAGAEKKAKIRHQANGYPLTNSKKMELDYTGV
jgi:hypothetical protein